MADDKVWASSFNGNILVMDLNGHPLGKEGDLPFKEQLSNLMGVGIAQNGDVWIAAGSADQLLLFPGGRLKDGKIVKVKDLASPFDVIIDPQNRVWVSNSCRPVNRATESPRIKSGRIDRRVRMFLLLVIALVGRMSSDTEAL